MIDSSYDYDRKLMIHSGSGDVDLQDILKATKFWFEHEAFDPTAPVVWDIRETFLNLSIEELRKLYNLVRDALPSKRTGGKTAWVHESGLVRAMIDILADEFDWGSQWKTFMAVDDAIVWCELN